MRLRLARPLHRRHQSATTAAASATRATLPVARPAVSPRTTACTSTRTAGRGFETPTFNELAYRPDGATGLNFALQAGASSDNYELGAKTAADARRAESPLALFETRHARRDRDPDERRRPLDVPERRRDAAPRHRDQLVDLERHGLACPGAPTPGSTRATETPS